MSKLREVADRAEAKIHDRTMGLCIAEEPISLRLRVSCNSGCHLFDH